MSAKNASQKKEKVSARLSKAPMDFFRRDQASDEPIFKDRTDFLDFSAKLTCLLGTRPIQLLRKAVEAMS